MEVSGRKDAKAVVDSISQSSAEDYDISCQPCLFEGNNVVAEGYCQTCSEYLCKTCLGVHRKQSVNRSHTILGLDQMTKVQQKTQDVCSKPCSVHFEEIVKFYCKSHDVVGCGDCMVLDHKSCQVDLVANMSSVTEDLNRNVKQHIDQFNKEIETTKHILESVKQEISENYSKVSQNVQKFRKEINMWLDDVEAELVLKANKARHEAENAVSERSKELQGLGKDLKQLSIEIAGNSEGRNNLFVSLTQAKEKLSYMKMSHMQIRKRNKIEFFEFEKNDHIIKLFSDMIRNYSYKISHNKFRIKNTLNKLLDL